MTSFKNYTKYNSNWPVELYKLTSFIASTFLWITLFYTDSKFIENSHFASLLALGNAFIYTTTKSHQSLPIYRDKLPFYFIFQFICLLGMSFAQGQNDFIYLTIMPVLMGMYFITFNSITRESFADKKVLFLYCFSFSSLLLFESFKKGHYFTISEVIALFSFCIWSLATAVWGFDFYIKGKKAIFSKLLSLSNEDKGVSAKNDKMFFHDIINHTHAMLLFLRSKRNDGIDSEELHTLVGELKLLQDNIQKHFGYAHKDLLSKNQYVPFQIALARVYSLVDSFFSTGSDVKITMLGDLADENNSDKLRDCTVDIVIFHRIMTNILKNAYEAKSSSIECIFEYDNSGLKTTIINDPQKLSDDKLNLDKDLGRLILDEHRNNRESIGLEAIGKICEENGGEFKFSYENGLWHSYFFLPKEVKKRENHLKKVA